MIWLFRLPQLRSPDYSFAFSLSSSALARVVFVFNGCFRGRERMDETFSHGFRRFSCPVGRSLFTGTFELRCGANLYEFCLAWISDHDGRRPSRTEAIPNTRGFRVSPSAKRPSEHRHPRVSRLWPATSSAAVSTTQRRTGSLDPSRLAAGKPN